MSSVPASQPNVAFEFVRSLAGELSNGKIDLPSFPQVAMRIEQVLSDPDASIAEVVRLVGSEPALAARLMRVSNAASFNRSGKPITDLRTAINRIGYRMVRSAAIAFAMSQMRRGSGLGAVESRMNDLWQRSTLVAAFSFVLARSCSTVSADEAMLTGMMHGLGKLYIMTRAARHPELFTDETILDEILKDWHAAVGKAILENWEFADRMAEAVGDQDDLEREDDEVEPDLRDVIAIAILMAASPADVAALEEQLEGLPATLRLGLDATRIRLVMEGSAGEIAALSETLRA